MARNQRDLKGIPQAVAPLGDPIPNTTEPEQKMLVAGPGAGAAILARPQVARLTADAAEFQPNQRHDPSGAIVGTNAENYFQPGERGTMAGARGDQQPTRLVGDMGGMPRAGYAEMNTPVDLGADLASGGEPDGPKTANESGPQDYFRSIKDFPGGKGSGTVSQNPGNTQGEAK